MSTRDITAESIHEKPRSGPTVDEIKASGQLRVGMGLVPTFATKDPNTGEVRGIAVELGRALADRLGVEFVPVTYPGPGNLPEALKAGAWDVAFLGVDPARAVLMDFSVPYVQVDSTFLFAPGTDYRSLQDLDIQGVQVATTRNGVEDLTLTNLVKAAEIIRVDAAGTGLAALKAGDVAAIAIARPTALTFAEQVPGSRVSDDRYAVAFHAIATPKGKTDLLDVINEFVSTSRAEGLVQQAMERVGLRGAEVAQD